MCLIQTQSNILAKLRWKAHIKNKKDELNFRYSTMKWLMGRQSKLSTNNKLLLYKQVLQPVWSYGCQLWGCSKPSNLLIIQRFQNKVLRNIVDAPWYIRNENLHRDLEVPTVSDTVRKMAGNHFNRLRQHPNPEIPPLLDIEHPRRLQRTKPSDLCTSDGPECTSDRPE